MKRSIVTTERCRKKMLLVAAMLSGALLSLSGPDHAQATSLMVVQDAINAVDPLHPTAGEDANDPANPLMLPVGGFITWTYKVFGTTVAVLSSVSVVDDNGTPGNP